MYVLRFTEEQGKAVNRPLYAKIYSTTTRGMGKRRAWQVVESPADATQWATREAADRNQAEFTSDYYMFAVETVGV